MREVWAGNETAIYADMQTRSNSLRIAQALFPEIIIFTK